VWCVMCKVIVYISDYVWILCGGKQLYLRYAESVGVHCNKMARQVVW
jgi:hypothetical protein